MTKAAPVSNRRKRKPHGPMTSNQFQAHKPMRSFDPGREREREKAKWQKTKMPDNNKWCNGSNICNIDDTLSLGSVTVQMKLFSRLLYFHLFSMRVCVCACVPKKIHFIFVFNVACFLNVQFKKKLAKKMVEEN